MRFFLMILESFLIKTIFKEDELNVKNKNFNPIKIIIIAFLIANNLVGVYFIRKSIVLYNLIEKECPVVIVKYKDK